MKARPTFKADESPEFLAFWNAWKPHKRHTDARPLARDEFVRHVEQYGADPQDIVDAAQWFIFTMKERDREYIPLSATWLNRRAYEEGAEEWRAHQKRLAERKSNVVQMSAPVTRSKWAVQYERERALKAAE